jgi:hypothetical protein
VLAENQALVEFKKQVVGLKKVQDADFVAKQKQALAVSHTYHERSAAAQSFIMAAVVSAALYWNRPAGFSSNHTTKQDGSF